MFLLPIVFILGIAFTDQALESEDFKLTAASEEIECPETRYINWKKGNDVHEMVVKAAKERCRLKYPNLPCAKSVQYFEAENHYHVTCGMPEMGGEG